MDNVLVRRVSQHF